MAAPMRKAETNGTAGDRDRFPPEAYLPGDDVSREATQVMREKAAPKVAGKKWKLVDGFGLSDAQ